MSQSIPRRSSGDLYTLLGVTSDVSPADLRRAYHKKALLLHPDKTNGATTEAFKQVQEANAILSDPDKRKLYDTFGRVGMAKLSQYNMDGAAATVIAQPHLIIGTLCVVWFFFLLLLVTVLLACWKVDHHKESWSWRWTVFAPLYADLLFYVLPIGVAFTYSGVVSHRPQIAVLGLSILTQVVALWFLSGAMDREEERFGYLFDSFSATAVAHHSAGGDRVSISKFAKVAKKSADGLSITFSPEEIAAADEEAFRAWRVFFVFQYMATVCYVFFSLMTLSVSDVKAALAVDPDTGMSSDDIEDITLSSFVYWRFALRRAFSVACHVLFIVLLKMKLCGEAPPQLSFFMIFAPIFLNIGLFPFINILQEFICCKGGGGNASFSQRFRDCFAVCSWIWLLLAALFATYMSMFTSLMVSEKLDRLYGFYTCAGLSENNAFSQMKSGSNHSHFDHFVQLLARLKTTDCGSVDEYTTVTTFGSGQPPLVTTTYYARPSLFLTLSLVICGLAAISCVFCLLVTTVSEAVKTIAKEFQFDAAHEFGMGHDTAGEGGAGVGGGGADETANTAFASSATPLGSGGVDYGGTDERSSRSASGSAYNSKKASGLSSHTSSMAAGGGTNAAYEATARARDEALGKLLGGVGAIDEDD